MPAGPRRPEGWEQTLCPRPRLPHCSLSAQEPRAGRAEHSGAGSAPGRRALREALTEHSDADVPKHLLPRAGEVAIDDRVVGDVGDPVSLPLRLLVQQSLAQGGLQTTDSWLQTAGTTVDLRGRSVLHHQLLWRREYLERRLTRPWKTGNSGQQVSPLSCPVSCPL